jgi:hypothetical protein
MRLWHLLLAGCSFVMPVGASSQGDTPADKLYRVVNPGRQRRSSANAMRASSKRFS